VWRIKYADAEGRQVQETIGAERDGVTRKLAEAELRERLVRVERKGYRRPKPLTFGEYAQAWLEAGQRSQGWKPSTILAYRNALDNYLVPAFGQARLNSIRPRDVSAFVAEMMSTPQGRHERPLTGRYVNLLLSITFSIFKAAVGEELVESNPVASVQRPKVERKRWRILEPREVPRVSKAFSDDRARRVFLTLALTGLRRSELVGLRWRHVNLVEGTLRVEQSKSEEGERLIALPRAWSTSWSRTSQAPRIAPRGTTSSAIRSEARSSRRTGTTSSSRRHSRPLGWRGTFAPSTTCATQRSRTSPPRVPRRSR
jgi:integrase